MPASPWSTTSGGEPCSGLRRAARRRSSSSLVPADQRGRHGALVSRSGERDVGELASRPDAELAVDPRERCLDGVLGEEERCGNLLVRVALGDKLETIRRSASVSSPRDGARPPMRASSARVCSAHRGAPSASKRASASSRVSAGGGALLRAALGAAEREQGPGVLEGVDGAGMLGERLLEARERSLGVASRREHERTAARENGERRRPIEHDARGSSRERTASASSSSPAATSASSRSPRSILMAGSSTKSPKRSFARLRCGRADAASPRESSMKPRIHWQNDTTTVIPSDSARAATSSARARASSVRPRYAVMTTAGISLFGAMRPSWAKSSRRTISVADRLVPVPRPPFQKRQVPEGDRLLPGLVPRPHAS